ncbi:gastrula zinc finger protein XlCGF57.1-like isoform X3 [Sphaerodactylus townsendi]|uniref:gastrula zinc finger protein XlCGF57.1-like isoform X3 n=1 Tax=Sphaerodactylus townsendi TaxID=933632 RepID=UPI0020261DCB|nr:gastrula zinc finger protein XlCGF57.1-like isoform X3 [Sphaerodactylus townsendi]
MEPGTPAQPQVTFEDVAVYFSTAEWASLEEWQRGLYRTVMVENYPAMLPLGRLSVKPEIICRIEQGREPCVRESSKPCRRRKPLNQWLGDEIRMVGEEEGEGPGTILRIPARRKRKKKDRSAGMEKRVTRASNAPAQALPRVTLKMNPPKCPECGKRFFSNVAMTIHIRSHTGERPFRCHLCPKAFPSRGDLKRHVKRHMPQSPPAAASKSPPAKGKRSVAAKLQLLRHLQCTPGPKKPHTCAQCGKSFDTKASLRKHEGTHSAERPFACLECGRRFRLKQILVSHMKSHVKERPFACAQCGKCFAQERNVRNHQRVHTGEKPFSCTACGKRFGYKQPLLKHLRLHTGERPFSCPECGKSFRDKATLVIHNRMHTGERPYRCAFCGKTCRQKQHLNSHLRVHRGEKLPSEGGTGRALQEKPYACPTCEKRFRDRKIMLAHQKTHEDEQPPRSGPLLGRAAPSQGEAKSAGKGAGASRKVPPASLDAKAPLVCPDCGSSFSQQKYLTLHRRSHR